MHLTPLIWIPAALLVAGCTAGQLPDAGSDRRSTTSSAKPLPSETAPEAAPLEAPSSEAAPVEASPGKARPAEAQPVEIEAYLFPEVPRHPAAPLHQTLSDKRVQVITRGVTASEAMDWYKAQLEERGWQVEATVLPPERVRLFSREGLFLSISAHEWQGDATLWLQERATPEVTQAEAVSIASDVHHLVNADQWIAVYLPDFESEGVRHPVWMLDFKAAHSQVTVWIDAITAEAFRIREASDY